MSLRLAITGLGAIAPNGHDADEFWASCLAGRSGIRRLQRVDAAGLDIDFGGEIVGFDLSPHFTRRELDRFDLTQLLAAAAVRMAVHDAHLEEAAYEPARVAVVVGSAAGSISTNARAVTALAAEG